VVKPRPLSPLDGGDPVLVTAETAGTREMPALNVSRDVKGEKPVPAAKPRAVIKPPAETADNGPALLPQRKPADLSPYEATVEAPRQTAPVTVLDVPPPPPAMPAGVRDAESVIDDLNSAEADAGNDQLAALPGMVEETVPRDAETPRAVHGDDAWKSAGLLIFDGDDTVIDDAMRDTLQGVARTLKKENGSRLLIRAYASGPDGSKAAARRVSLSRALAVRSFLMDEGLEPSRVDVRALGRDTDVSPADRVDLVLNGQY
jgi:outer membrane protein OmpA-like peptidoglycan-associated protein